MATLIDTDLAATTASPAPAARPHAAAGSSLPITDIIFLTLRHWPWVLLSLVVCVGAAMVYILRTPTVYTRAAEIMIKDNSKGKSAGAEEFANFGLLSSNTNVQNEITNLRSADLMEDVVRRLDLDINYTRPGRFHNQVAYGTSLPVDIDLPTLSPEAALSFDLEVSPAGEVTIDNLRNGDVVDGTFTGHLADTIATPVAAIIVNPSKAFTHGKEIELHVDKWPMATAQAVYSGRLGVAQTADNSSVVRLTFSDQSVERADAVLSTLIEVYQDSWIRDRNEIAISTSQFINERLGIIEQELGNVDNDISTYKSENLIPDVGAAAGQYMNRKQQLDLEIQALERQTELARLVRTYLTSPDAATTLLPANAGLVGDIAGQINSYNDMLLNRNALAAKSSEQNPTVQNLDRQLEQLRTAIVTTVDTHLTALGVQLSTLRAARAATTGQIATTPSQAKYLLSVERQQKVKESLYLFLLQKREENELSQAFTAYNTRVVRRPGAAGAPPTPNKSFILMIAALIGLTLPFAVTFLIESSNTRIRGRKDIEHLTLPFLGEIPQYGRGKKAAEKSTSADKRVSTLVVKEGRRNVINEAFRVLRTNIEFMNAGHPGRATIIAITSFNPHSGKSFITMNLAMTLAIKHRRVLVIDGDMRHGSTSAYVDSPGEGLSNYLNGSVADISAAIISDPDAPSLHILPIGPVPPNPTELLESPRFEQMLEELRPLYDYILIDCPPIEVVADAQIIDKYVDRTIFILRAGLLERSMLPELERLYTDKKYRSMAVILNGTQMNHRRYGYGYATGYRYGYGYGYGYGYNYSTEK